MGGVREQGRTKFILGHIVRVLTAVLSTAAIFCLSIGWGACPDENCVRGLKPALNGSEPYTGVHFTGRLGRGFDYSMDSVEGSTWGLRLGWGSSAIVAFSALLSALIGIVLPRDSATRASLLHGLAICRVVLGFLGGILATAWGHQRVMWKGDTLLVVGWMVGGAFLLIICVFAVLETLCIGCPCLVRKKAAPTKPPPYPVSAVVPESRAPESQAAPSRMSGSKPSSESRTTAAVSMTTKSKPSSRKGLSMMREDKSYTVETKLSDRDPTAISRSAATHSLPSNTKHSSKHSSKHSIKHSYKQSSKHSSKRSASHKHKRRRP